MIEIKQKEKCTGCAACANICPKGAIKMVADQEGFKYPVVDKTLCINCNLCNKICPLKNEKENHHFTEPKVYAGWTKNEKVRLDSTSGGIFSEIANYVYDNDGYVSGAIYNKEWLVEHYISNNKKDLEKIRSSKYLQSDINDTYQKIEELLKENKTVLFCGSPCQVEGLYSYLKKEYDNLITVDFICRGINSPKIFSMYIKSLKDKYKSDIKNIKFKNKKYGWHNFNTKIEFENKKIYHGGRYTDSYMVGYLKHNAFMRPSCYECKFRNLPRRSDITLADFWGIEKINQNLDNNQGTSMVIINSSKGEEVLNGISEKIQYEEINDKKIFNENVCMNYSPKRSENRTQVFENIDKMTYEELNKKFFTGPDLIRRIKLRLKRRMINKD